MHKNWRIQWFKLCCLISKIMQFNYVIFSLFFFRHILTWIAILLVLTMYFIGSIFTCVLNIEDSIYQTKVLQWSSFLFVPSASLSLHMCASSPLSYYWEILMTPCSVFFFSFFLKKRNLITIYKNNKKSNLKFNIHNNSIYSLHFNLSVNLDNLIYF